MERVCPSTPRMKPGTGISSCNVKGVNGEVGSDETTVLWACFQGKCRKFGTDSLGGQYRWFTSPRKTQRQWMDDIEEWSGCSYIQLK